MDVFEKVEIEELKSPVQKLAHEQRRLRFKVKPQSSKWVNWFERLKSDSQFLRQTIQICFLIISLVIGFQFFLWVKWVESEGNLWTVSRPPGVEAFLPIGSLISLKYWIKTGVINDIHPSGLFILLAIVTISLLFRKSFCSWVCPVGWISEKAWQLGNKVLGRNYRIPQWLDRILRGIKYFLMAFFLWIIFFIMDTEAISDFIQGPYNRVADIKMIYFFIHMTGTAAIVLLVLFVLSMVYKNFWCRYLCPYGALLGLFSRLSPVKVTRNVNSCIDCKLCTRACPSFLPVHKLHKVTSEECTACVSCIEVCPVKDTLDLRTTPGNRKIPVPVFAALIAGIFFIIIGIAMLTGHWKNNISDQEYFHHIHQINSPEYTHF